MTRRGTGDRWSAAPGPHRRVLTIAPIMVALVLTNLLIGAVAGPTRTGDAQETGTAEASSALRVVEQTPWVTADGTWVLRVVPDERAATLSVTLHEGVVGRDPFARGLSGDPLEPVLTRRCAAVLETGPAILDTCEIPLDQAALDDDGAVTVVLGLRSSAAGPTDRLLVPSEGVYPVSVAALTDDGTALDQITTHVVRLPTNDDSPPLAVALLVPYAAPLALQPDGTIDLGNSLEALSSIDNSLSRHPGVALSIVPSPETLVAVDATAADTGSPLARQGPGPGRQVLRRPYVDLDVTSWWEAGLGAELVAQLDAGAAAAETTGSSVDRRSWLMEDTASPETLTRLAGTGIDRVVVPEEMLAPLDEALFPVDLDRPFEVTDSEGQTLPAVMDDALLQAHAGSTGDAALDAHHLLADLAVLYFQRPATPRGVAVSFSPEDLQDPIFLDTVLAGLANPTIVEGSTLDELFATATPALAQGIDATDGPILVRTTSSTPANPLGDYPQRLDEAIAQQATIRSLFGTVDADLADQFLLVSGDRSLSPQEQRAYLDASVELLAQVTNGIIAPEQAAVTLTAREGQIPVVVRNDLDQPVDVAVTLQSEKLEFPEGDSMITTLPPGESRLEFTVSTRASGAFPVDVIVTSPDGALDLDETRFTLRSTVVPGVGLVLSALAAVFLMVWWARHWRTTRRDRRLVLIAGDHPSSRTAAQTRQDAIDDITRV